MQYFLYADNNTIEIEIWNWNCQITFWTQGDFSALKRNGTTRYNERRRSYAKGLNKQ